jgi:hypothetical protein
MDEHTKRDGDPQVTQARQMLRDAYAKQIEEKGLEIISPMGRLEALFH